MWSGNILEGGLKCIPDNGGLGRWKGFPLYVSEEHSQYLLQDAAEWIACECPLVIKVHKTFIFGTFGLLPASRSPLVICKDWRCESQMVRETFARFRCNHKTRRFSKCTLPCETPVISVASQLLQKGIDPWVLRPHRLIKPGSSKW